MDCVCCFCGDPWHTDTVLHIDPDLFCRQGAVITGCPSCADPNGDGTFHRRPRAVRHPRSEELTECAHLCEDVCEFASDLEDFLAAALLDPGEWTQEERDAYRDRLKEVEKD